MSRNVVSIFLSILFLAFIAGPTVLLMVDDSIDVSIYYASSSSEEEENNNPNSKEIKVLTSVQKENELQNMCNKTVNNLGYSFKNYPKIHLNLISPPPELSVI